MAVCPTCGQETPDEGDELTIQDVKNMTAEEVAARLDEVNEVMQAWTKAQES
jgi:hypothetical protein